MVDETNYQEDCRWSSGCKTRSEYKTPRRLKWRLSCCRSYPEHRSI